MTDPNAPSRPSRRRLWLPYLLLLAVAVAWSGYWYVGRGQALSRLEALRIQAGARGQTLSCVDEGLSGFPFRFEYRCGAATLSDAATGTTVTVPGLSAVTLAYRPTHLILESTGPVTLTDRAGANATVDWQTLRASVRFRRNAIERVSVVADTPTVEATAPGLPRVEATAQAVQVHVRQAEGSDPASGYQDLEIALAADGLRTTDVGASWSGTVDVRATRVPTGSAPADTLLRAWQAAGGSAVVERFHLSDGGTVIAGSGEASVTDAGRIDGRFEIGIAGSTPASVAGASGAEMLLGYLNTAVGFFGETRTVGGREMRAVDVTIADGRVSVGAMPVATLPRLY